MSQMPDEEYRAGLRKLRADWGRMSVDPRRPGVLLAEADPTTGLIAGMRAPIIAEIINRAITEEEGKP